jgi:hypothetical protein
MSSLQERVSKLLRLIRRSYFLHFSGFIFVGLATILTIGIIFINHNASFLDYSLWAATLAAFLLLVAAITYYAGYFVKYQNLIDAYTQRQYYYDIYSFWGITFFNILFICSFALIGVVIERWSLNKLFGGATYENMLFFFFREVIDDGTFGLLDAFNITSYDLPSSIKISFDYQSGVSFSTFRWSDLFVSTYIYIATLTIALAFWASIVAELVDWIQVRREVSKLFETKIIEPEPLSSIEIKRNHEILRCIKAKKINVAEYEVKLIHILKESKSKEVRDLFLQIMDATENMVVFKTCLDYFKNSKDERFKRVCKRIKHTEKRKLVADFESRQIKKMPWRGRGKKTNP